jgi:hypothetical protein
MDGARPGHRRYRRRTDIGVFLAVGAHVVLVEVSGAIWMQIVVSVVGIALMTAVAYYRSWSKAADKKKPPPVVGAKPAVDARRGLSPKHYFRRCGIS